MSTDPSSSPTTQLYVKLLEVAQAIPFIEKRGTNDHHGYKFAQALDVVRDVRAQLHERGVIVIPGAIPGSVQHHVETGGKSFVTTVDLVYRFVDTDTGIEVCVPWAGAGADTGGDKGLYKAMTGGLKYALLAMFLLPMTEDPEHDGLTQPAPAADSSGQDRTKDAERPAAPLIPPDRARSILTAAQEAGLAAGTSVGVILKAKLATLGVQKIGALNVDQAETVEAFLREEAAATAGRSGAGDEQA